MRILTIAFSSSVMKLVTFWARIFKRFAMTYCPEFNDIEEYDIFRVAMIAFSSSAEGGREFSLTR